MLCIRPALCEPFSGPRRSTTCQCSPDRCQRKKALCRRHHCISGQVLERKAAGAQRLVAETGLDPCVPLLKRVSQVGYLVGFERMNRVGQPNEAAHQKTDRPGMCWLCKAAEVGRRRHNTYASSPCGRLYSIGTYVFRALSDTVRHFRPYMS